MTDSTWPPPGQGDNAPVQPRGNDPVPLGTGSPTPMPGSSWGPPPVPPSGTTAPPPGTPVGPGATPVGPMGEPGTTPGRPMVGPTAAPFSPGATTLGTSLAPPGAVTSWPPTAAPAPEPSGRPTDPLAAALGNATLLGLGYLLLRRRGAAIGAFLTTGVLVLLLAAFGQPGWFWRGVLLIWWITTIIHGWRLARRSGRAQAAGRQRLVAAGAAAVVALAVAGAAVDDVRLGGSAAAAHGAGNCAEAIETLDGIAAWHRIVDPFVDGRASDEVATCTLLLDAQAAEDPAEAATLLAQYLAAENARWAGAADLRVDQLLAAAGAALDGALGGDIDQLELGFDLLAEVLTAAPDQVEAVSGVLSGYVAALPDADPCDAMEDIEWLDARSSTGDSLDAAAEEAAGIAPPVVLACGDKLLTADPEGALAAYQTVLDRYPDNEVASAAAAGVNNAETNIEGKRLRELVAGAAPYCTSPAPYRAAPPFQSDGGPHLLVVLGSSTFSDDVPQEWRAADPTQATLVLCVDGPSAGSQLRSCDYEGGWSVGLMEPTFQVRAFEVRTGTLAFETTVGVGGDCPDPLRWECPQLVPNCPPPGTVLAVYDASAISDAVSPWVFR